MQRKFNAEIKAKVALEAIREQKTTSEIASAHGVHPTQVTNWKKHAISHLQELFPSTNGTNRSEKTKDELIRRLYEQIGQLKVEADWLKKNSHGVS